MKIIWRVSRETMARRKRWMKRPEMPIHSFTGRSTATYICIQYFSVHTSVRRVSSPFLPCSPAFFSSSSFMALDARVIVVFIADYTSVFPLLPFFSSGTYNTLYSSGRSPVVVYTLYGTPVKWWILTFSYTYTGVHHNRTVSRETRSHTICIVYDFGLTNASLTLSLRVIFE